AVRPGVVAGAAAGGSRGVRAWRSRPRVEIAFRGVGMPTPQDREAARRAQMPVRYALALLVCVIGALVAVGAIASYRIYELGNKRFVDQAGPFFGVTEDLAVEMLNEETGVRGYVITGDPKTLAPYRQGRLYAHQELDLIA